MDFTTELPLTMQGHDAIMVFMVLLAKMVRLANTTTDVLVVVVIDLFLT